MSTPRRPRLNFATMFPTVPGKCRCGCEQPIGPRRRCWASSQCSNAAVERYRIARGYVAAIREAVFRRDRGVCAGCGMDTEIERARSTPGAMTGATAEERATLARWMHAGFPSPKAKAPWWQADHVLPLAEGGENAIGNFRTLCLPCHRRETARLAGRLAAARRLTRRAQPARNAPNHESRAQC